MQNLASCKKDGDVVEMEIEKKGKVEGVKITLDAENSRSFEIKRMANPDALQTGIYNSVFGPVKYVN